LNLPQMPLLSKVLEDFNQIQSVRPAAQLGKIKIINMPLVVILRNLIIIKNWLKLAMVKMSSHLYGLTSRKV